MPTGARLVEKSLYDGLSVEEESSVPPELLAKAREHIQRLVSEGLRDREAGRISDGPEAMNKLREQLRVR